jgi:hypothetical protein
MAIFGDHKLYVQLALIYSVVFAVIQDRNKGIWGITAICLFIL